jgi:hypothetical protein
MFDPRLIRAEILKLRRRRGMMALCASFLGLAVVAYTVANVVDAPAGGLDRFEGAVGPLALLGAVVGVIVGGTAGAADIESGVFRDLVATGRSRMALYGARVTGALAIVLPMLLLAIGFEAAWCTILAGSQPAPDAQHLLSGIASVLAAGTFGVAACVGLAALLGSRGPVIGVALTFQLAISPLLAQIDALGAGRRAIPAIAVGRIGDGSVLAGYSLALAIVVLIAWTAALLAAGAWRTRTQEI